MSSSIMTRKDDIVFISRFLDQHGLLYRFERRCKHMAVIVTQGGRDVVMFFPLTGNVLRARTSLCARRDARGLVGAGRAAP
jgi:hypothetical protein